MSEAAQALGQKLKAEREKRGMSAQKMADDMHLDAWVIDALEAGDYERIGPSVYAQGHLRKYASILGVLAAQAAPVPQTKPAGPAVPTPIIRLDPPGGDGGALWPMVGGFAVIALVAGGIAWWRPWHAAPAASVRAPAAPVAAASVPAPDSIPAPSPANVPAGYLADTADAGVAAEAASAGAVPASRSTAAAPIATPSSAPSASPATSASVADLTPGVGRARLRLSFSADSRVAVYDYTGKSVFTGNGRANSVKTLSGMAPFRVYLGFASGVQLEVNDRAVAIGPQFVSGDVARFEAGADGVLRRDPGPMPAGAAAPAPPTPAAPRG
jgi:cytoskeleton protein RodZ